MIMPYVALDNQFPPKKHKRRTQEKQKKPPRDTA